MVKLKRAFTYLFLFVVVACGLLAGCTDKYANLKIVCDKQEQGVTLYVGEEGKEDTTDIVFSVEGAGDGVSTKLLFSFEQNSQTKIVDIVSEVAEGANTTVTIKALRGGETTLVARHEESNKTCRVFIKNIVSAQSMDLNTTYKGVVVAGGEPLVLNTAQIIKFTPEDTTENKISYSLKSSVEGVTLTESGLLTVAKEVKVNTLTVVAKNTERTDLANVEFDVKVISHIADEDISIISEGEKINEINLVSNFATENKKSINVDVNTTEIFNVKFTLVDKNDTSNHNINFVSFISNQGANAVLMATNVGQCLLKIDIIVSDTVAKTVFIPVNSVELAKNITVNGNTEDYSENIYTTYSNNLGHKFNVQVGNAFSADRTYFVAIAGEDADKIAIFNADMSAITPSIKTGDTYSENYTVLQNDTDFYVLGLTPNSSCTISIFATSTFSLSTKTVLNINLTTLLGAESISVEYTNEQIASKTIFVEVGKSAKINYTVTQQNASVVGLDLVSVGEQSNYSYVIENNQVIITGLKSGKSTAKLVLPNMVESELFVVYVFESIKEVYASVESPLTSNNIAKVEYNGRQLTSFVMSLGVYTKLQFDYVGSLYDLTCKSNDADGEQIAVVSKDGNIFARNVGQTTINVSVITFVTKDGSVALETISFDIALTVYVPIKNVNLSSTVETLYYKEELNKVLYDSGAYTTNISISLYPHNVYVQDENLQISWVSSNNDILKIEPNADKLIRTIYATKGDDTTLDTKTEYIDIIVNYYGSIITKRCVVNIINPVRAQGMIVSQDELYFDSRQGVCDFNGALQTNGVAGQQINSIVYPADTTDKKVTYSGYDKSIVYITEDGKVYPVGVGLTYVTVTAQDSIVWFSVNNSLMYTFEPKVIKIIVADGKTEQTAFKISDEQTFLSVKNDIQSSTAENVSNNYYYYFANDVYLKNPVDIFGVFAGSIDGKNHNIYNLAFKNANDQYIFEQNNGTIKNLFLNASVDCQLSQNATISILVKNNVGKLQNISTQILNYNVKNQTNNVLVLSGLVANNSGEITDCMVNANIVLIGSDCAELTIGMLSAINNGVIYGQNDNYFSGEGSYQNFDVQGSIATEVSSTTSFIGGVVGVNNNIVGSNTNGASDSKGLASNVLINTPKLNNVGGIAGKNTNQVNNALVYGNIKANNNVGGIVGINTKLTEQENIVSIGRIATSIVELYQNPFIENEYYSIVGAEYVGGLAGYFEGTNHIQGDITNSYIISYGNKSMVESQGYAGGVVGYACDVNIYLTSANVLVKGNTVGGLVGAVKNVNAENTYSRGKLETTLTSGKMFGEVLSSSSITTSYSTVADADVIADNTSTTYFTGKIKQQDEDEDGINDVILTTQSSYHLSNGTTDASQTALSADTTNNITKTADLLTDISTYTDWSISDEQSNNENWYINSQKNDGYPVIKYASFIQYKTTATKISVIKKDSVNYSGDIVILNIDETYQIANLFNITTDVSGVNSTIIITTDVQVELNGNILSSNSTIKSATEQLVTLTFILQTNTSVKASVKLLFTKQLGYFQFAKSNVTIKVGESEKITGHIFDSIGNMVEDNGYYFGTSWSDNIPLSVTNSVYDSTAEMLYFQSGSVFTAIQNYEPEISLNVKLYKKIGNTFIDVFGNKANDKSVTLKIIVSKGASNIDIDKKQISMTIINTLTLNVTIYTDNPNEKLYIADNEYLVVENENENVIFEKINSTDKESQLFKLSLISTNFNNNAKTFVFELKFIEDYRNGTLSFAYPVTTQFSFIAKNNDIEYSTIANINAKPQDLLKIDLLHFPAGKQTTVNDAEGNLKTIYDATQTPSNTLVPGQIGLLAIDLYPQNAFFDELQITSTVDAQGNYINFIQVAFSDEGKYIELKPNAEIISNGIVLSKQSNYSNLNTSYDGKIYVKTLVTTNVNNQTTFNVKLAAYRYLRNEQGKIIYGNDGKPQTKITTLQKSMDIVVSPNPDIKLFVNAKDQYQAPVQTADGNVHAEGKYYLITKGQTINIDTVTKNFASKVNYHFDSEVATFINGILSVKNSVKIGTIFTLQASVTKNLNGIEVSYDSQKLQFCVVDYILTDANFANGTKNIVLQTGELTPINVALTGLGNVSAQNSLKSKLEKSLQYWSQPEGSDCCSIEVRNNVLQFKPVAKGDTDAYLRFNYIYQNGKLTVLDNTDDITSVKEFKRTFTIDVIQISSPEKPKPIKTITDFYDMKNSDEDYILLEDLVFYADDTVQIETEKQNIQTKDAYRPFELNVNSFDGNCHKITIKGFDTKGDAVEYLGLFTNIGINTVVKNVFVIYEDVGSIIPATDSQVIFGGLASQNQGVVTNSIVTYSATQTNTAQLSIQGNYNTVGAFVGINSGLITYSTAQGQSAIVDNELVANKNFTITSNGDLAGFACTNSNLIANSQTRYIGLNNTTSANSNAKTAGFVCTNSGKIYYSSVEGQTVQEYLDEKISLLTGKHFKEEDEVRAFGTTDERLIDGLADNQNYGFAILESKCNIAGFVYKNNGEIMDTYSNIPMKTQARTSGFVFEIASAGSIWTSYTVSYFDGKFVDDNTAHTPFIGTNELGEVLNDSQNIRYSYYVSDVSYTELDSRFSQVATAISFDDCKTITSYVGFDISSNDIYAVWHAESSLPTLQSQYNNYSNLVSPDKPLQRNYHENATSYEYSYNTQAGSAENPYLIATAQEFLHIKEFNPDYKGKQIPSINIRLINNLDFSSVDQQEVTKLQNYNFIGDFDGSGLTISHLRISGTENANLAQFGLFKQIGSFATTDNNGNDTTRETTIRSLTVSVDEFAKSTSTFTGILSGVIVNTKLKNVNVNAKNITVLGKNVVGGVAGIIIGKSSIYNVSANASVEAAYLGIESGNYQNVTDSKKLAKSFSEDDIDLSNLQKLTTSHYNKLSYAGGIAGIIALYDNRLHGDEKVLYKNISYRTPNIQLAKVSGDIALTAEKVGGLFGYSGKDVYIANSQFEVSASDNQKLKGYYISGGLIAENYGVMFMSKVEIQANRVEATDTALTNITGQNLFVDEATNPVYIGGLVGINYGGLISTSYSKTNVVHYNAKYAGGLIGFATNNGSTDYTIDNDGNFINYRPTILDEVYTTGNVFAGANYNEKEEVKDENGNTVKDENGNPIYFSSSSKNLAGGIFGKLHLNDYDLSYYSGINHFAHLQGVLGLNGFYKPYGYTIDSTLNDSGVNYGMLAKGFDGNVKLSNNTTQTTTYSATIGAFAGEVDTKDITVDIKDGISFGVENIEYNYMYSTFVYNASNITANACASAVGSEISMIANSDTVKLNKHNTYADKSGAIITIGTGTNVNSYDANTVTIAPNNAYLLYRSEDVNGKLGTKTINYSDYVQDFDGLYSGWSILTWKTQSPVYPKFVEKDTTGYIEIKTEADLKKINNNYSNYMLVKDIWLSENFTPIGTFIGNFESAPRNINDGPGLNGSNYYGIYNIKLDVEVSNTVNSIGLFANIDGATIKNIDFVVSQISVKDDKKSNNEGILSVDVGSIVGYAENSTITNCNVYYNMGTSTTVSGEYQDLNVGTVVGRVENCQVDGSFNYGAVTVDDINNITISDKEFVSATALTPTIDLQGVSANRLNVGGLIGLVDGTLTTGINIKCDQSNINVQNCIVDRPAVIAIEEDEYLGTANIGGLFGQVVVTDGESATADITVSDLSQSKLTINGEINTTNIGGIIGFADRINVNAQANLDTIEITDNNLTTKQIMLGGFVGYVGYNSISVAGATIDVCNITTNATILSSAGEEGNINIGGFVAYAGNGINFSNNTVKQFNLTTETLSVANNTNIGGFAGFVVSTSKNINCNVYNANIDLSSENLQLGDNLYIGGFAGRGECTLDTSIVKGAIVLPSKLPTEYVWAGGYAGQMQECNQDNNTASQLSNCYVDVKITAKATAEKMNIAGFANIDNTVGMVAKVALTNCVALGNIVYNQGVYTGYATGFIDYITGKIKNCYTLTSLKLVSETNNRISAENLGVTGSISGCSIYFNYNLTASANYFSADNIKTFTEILNQVKSLTIYTDYVSKLSDLSNAKISAEYNNSGYYMFKNNSADIDNNQFVVDDHTKTLEFNITNSTTFEQDMFISGFTFKIDADNYITENNGYLFNCMAVSSDNQNLAQNGFVNTNNGIINACGTIANIAGATESNVSTGFVNTNSGIITNSFANGLIINITTDGKNIGFVNINDGYIFNSYTSTTMFNRNTSTDSAYTNGYGFVAENNGSIKNCYFDTTSTAYTQTISDVKNVEHNINLAKSLKGLSIGQAKDNKLYINYGMPTTVSFAEAITTDTNNTVDKEYIANVKNIQQFIETITHLNSKQTIIQININILTSLDGMLTKTVCSSYSNSGATLILNGNDNYIYSLNVNKALLTAQTITINDININAKFSNNNYSVTNAINGLIVGSATNLTTTNVDIVLTEKTNITAKTNTNFGILAGSVTNLTTTNTSVTASVGDIKTMQNFGVIAGWASNVTAVKTNVVINNVSSATKITNFGLFVGYVANKLTATSCYSGITSQLTINNISNFGVFAGRVNNAIITDAFTTGDIYVKSINDNSNIGHFIGYQSGTTSCINNVFTSGTLTIDSTITSNNVGVGGIFGLMMATTTDDGSYDVLSTSYTNVTIKNYSLINETKIYVGAIAGIAQHTKDSIGEQRKYPASNLNAEANAIKYKNNIDTQVDNISYIIKENRPASYEYKPDIKNPDGTVIFAHYLVRPADVLIIAINTSNVYFDPNISLVDVYVGNFDTDKNVKTTQNELFTTDIFGTGKFSKHFPIQQAFADDEEVYSLLKINKYNETGSRMSPIDIIDNIVSTDLNSAGALKSKFETNNYYYLGVGTPIAEVIDKIENVTIYGRGNTVTLNRTYLFTDVSNSVITGLTIKNGILAKNTYNNAIAKNCTTNGFVSVPAGFIETASNTYLFNCSVDLLGLTSSNQNVGGMLTWANDIVYIDNPSVSISSSINLDYTGDKTTYFGGIVSVPNNNTLYIKNPTIKELTIYSKSTKDNEIGGVSAYVNKDAKINLSGNVSIGSIKFYLSNSKANNYLGLIYSNVNFTTNTPNSTISIFDKQVTVKSIYSSPISLITYNNVWETESTSSTYTGTFGRFMGSNYIVDLDNLKIDSKIIFKLNQNTSDIALMSNDDITQEGGTGDSGGNSTGTNKRVSNIYAGGIVGLVHDKNTYLNAKLTETFKVTLNHSPESQIGGIIGRIENSYGNGNTYAPSFINFVQSGDVNVTDNNSITNTYVGGFAGYSATSGTISGTSTGLVAATSDATSSVYYFKINDFRQGEKEISIPLTVGGIFGRFDYNNTDVSGVTKTEGGVRALLTADNSEKGLKDEVVTYKNVLLGQEKIIINEDIQCRAGGFAGLASSTINGVAISKASYINNTNLGISTGTNEATAFNSVDDIYSKMSNTKTRSGLSMSSITPDNIFTNSNTDKSHTYDETYKKTYEYLKENWTLVLVVPVSTDEHIINENISYVTNQNAVFAGYNYDGITYNRSYWMKQEKLEQGDTNPYDDILQWKDIYSFISSEHWAGSQIGGVLVS